MEPLDPEVDPPVLGPFELHAVLGQGGMGRAYLARRLPLEGLGPEWEHVYHLAGAMDGVERGLVAVKVIKPQAFGQGTPEQEHEARARFAQEIDAVRAVVSDRVPALIAADPHADRPWLAMDYVHGPTLSAVVHAHGPFPPGPYAALGLAMVDALRAVHGANLLHRDLKPGNVVLGPAGPAVLDFGLAVLADRDPAEALTQTGASMGTPPYYPLEQHQDTKSVGRPADVYGLGGTLFFAATGRPPYPFGPMLTEPYWGDIDATFVPLLARILVQFPTQRPDLDAVEQSLQFLLVEHGLAPEEAEEQLRTLVRESGLIPELPPRAVADDGDADVRQAAQRAVDDGYAPDQPWREGEQLFDELFPDPEPEPDPAPEPTPPAPPADPPVAPAPVTDPLPEPPHPPVPPGPQPVTKKTSYRLAPPLRPPVAPPAESPAAARRAAERLRKAYAHSTRL